MEAGKRDRFDGTGAKVLAAVLAAADADDSMDWTVSVDSTVVRA